MIGTRDHFRSWLSTVKGITYTVYVKLDIEAKAKLYGQYRSGRTA